MAVLDVYNIIGLRRGKVKVKKEKQEQPTVTICECYSANIGDVIADVSIPVVQRCLRSTKKRQLMYSTSLSSWSTRNTWTGQLNH